MNRKYVTIVFVIFGLFVVWGMLPSPAQAYVGPGAGFAFVSTFFVFLATFFFVLLTLLFWPLRFVFRMITGQLSSKKDTIDKLVVLGFDGMDPELATRWMNEGKLPNLKKLADSGTFQSLRSTTPAISPVAWSTFSTGVNPGKHNIYDFLSRNVQTYLPELSSAHIGDSLRSIKIGKYRIPLGKPSIRLLRKSRPFWKILGEHGFFSHILRVPITFPPEKFNGLSLSAMCVPDLQGTQGTFTFYSSEVHDEEKHTGGEQIPITVDNDTVKSSLVGPANSLLAKEERMEIPFTLVIDRSRKEADLILPDQTIRLKQDVYSEWITLTFKPLLWIKVTGICRFLLKEVDPCVKLYVTPINIAPEKPALPISHPMIYSVYLAKMQGAYATLGLAEDTWALNEGVIEDPDFIEQCYTYHYEREEMFFNALERTKKGVCAVVFDTTDRMQHMFYRYLDKEHPALEGKDRSKYADVIEKLYIDCDRIVGKTMKEISDNDVFMVISDHGFKTFSRGINLNTWLLKNGYLYLKENKSHSKAEWFADVDWSRTKAYNLGLGGIYLNIKGREHFGIVEDAEVQSLKEELSRKLEGLVDPVKDKIGIQKVYDRNAVYDGPYVYNAPDLIIGYGVGYRASWDGVTGIVGEEVFEDNLKSWSGDHCVDPTLVPGVIFCNRMIEKEDPGLVDIAPTALSLFHVAIPAYMDGKPLFNGTIKSESPAYDSALVAAKEEITL